MDIPADPIMDPLADPQLGLDNVKIKPKRRIAKIDNDRILHTQKGLPYLIKNNQRLNRIIAKNDKTFQKQEQIKSSVNKNYKTPNQLKYDHEYSNLTSILQFYQLWCHGLFPKANFKDCAYLIRSLGHKSSQLRLYRRELIEKEIHKLKVSKGIIDENDDQNENGDNDPINNEDDLYTIPATNNNTNSNDDENLTVPRPTAVSKEDDDDFFNFMNQDETTNNQPQLNEAEKESENAQPNNTNATHAEEDNEEFDDEDDFIPTSGHISAPRIVQEDDSQPTQQEQEDMEMELMRQYNP
ncbi:CSM3 [Candida jiufengensis]|uniref:CSM3 n=1 Tax=Candida jiufengensis TaxID=497108 RepID=UPI0022250F04|nr:CSM3 [Candida jiufengensis]KAI5953678.1 CSM3 [Candida jiufengensis]